MDPEESLNEVLDDLCARFLINLPASEFESFERLFFAIESAHWFYEDFSRENNRRLPKLALKAFAARLFNHTPLLAQYRSEVDRLTSEFKSYKQEVPTCGAAMLNTKMDKVVLVKGWGSSGKWGFPKGKVAKDETELASAVREVLEETGFDLENYVNESTFYIDSMTQGRLNRIFVVPGIPEDAHFETQTRKEISAISWVPIASLPEFQKKGARQNQPPADNVSGSTGPSPAKMSFHVAPYTVRLRSWIRKQRKGGGSNRRPSKPSAPSAVRKSGGPTEHLDVQERGEKGKLTDKGVTVESSRVPQGSPQKGKRGKKDKRKQDRKDAETFGVEASNTILSAEQKLALYDKYKEDTDERAKQLSLHEEDMWPTAVPGKHVATRSDEGTITQPVRSELGRSQTVLAEPVPSTSFKSSAKENNTRTGDSTSSFEGPVRDLPPFTFDVDRILAKMLA